MTNKELVQCWKDFDNKEPNCRFLVLGENRIAFCKRNPTPEQKFRLGECFAGEPIVRPYCGNCKLEPACKVINENDTTPCWHCSDWEPPE